MKIVSNIKLMLRQGVDVTFVKQSASTTGCFSFCLILCSFEFFQEWNSFWIRRQAFASFKHGFLRSEENGNNICQGIPSACTTPWHNICHDFGQNTSHVSMKLQDTPTPIHHLVLEIIVINIFFRPEEAMFENLQKLVS